MGDGTDEQSLLQEIRQQLSQVVAYREEHERLLRSLEDRLDLLDGLAQRVALLGFLQEGINVLVLQHDLTQQGAQLHAAIHEADVVERRLRAAEEALLVHTDDALPSPQNDKVVSDTRASTDSASGHRLPRIGLEHSPGFADD